MIQNNHDSIKTLTVLYFNITIYKIYVTMDPNNVYTVHQS